MICNMFLRMRTHGEYVDHPACGVVVLNRPLLDTLTRLDECAKAVYMVGGFSVSFLCGFTVYEDAAVPEDPYWGREVIAKLEDEDSLIIWTDKPIDWGERDSSVCLAVSYGKGNIVFQSLSEHGAGSIESDFIALSDIRKWSLLSSL